MTAAGLQGARQTKLGNRVATLGPCPVPGGVPRSDRQKLREEIGRSGSVGMVGNQTIHAIILRDGGQPSRALRIFEDLLGRHRSLGGDLQSVPAIEYDAALTLLRLGRPAEALPLFEDVMAAAGKRGDAVLTRGGSVGTVLALTDTGQLARARSLLLETEPLYVRLRAGKQYVARLCLFAMAHLSLAQGDAAGARAAIEEARSILRLLPNPGDPAWRVVHTYSARLALHERRFDDWVRSATEALQLSQEQALDPAASVYVGEDLVLRAQSRQASGDLVRAREDARLALQHFEATGATAHPAGIAASAIVGSSAAER